MPENCVAIVIAAKHHELTKVKDTRGTTNTIGALRCNFQFRTDDWLHSAKTAMFCKGNAVLHPEVIDDAISVPLDADNECPVPYEVLIDTQPYSVGVWGVTDTGLRIVSNWLVFGAQTGCYAEGNAPGEPEKTVYDEIRLISQSAVNAANEVSQRANSGEFNGKSAYELAKEEGFEGTQSEWVNSLGGIPGKDGVDGKDGADAISPTVSVEGIDGGHRVVITDKNGDKTFDVMDGQGGFDGEMEAFEDLTDEVNKLKATLEALTNNVKAARIGEVTLLADAWVGADNLYSQVVTLEGVTENSQVDLTPSVQQLAIFYNKDLTFVTENDGGVVTVYVIGQKPANDYTIQVTITEVEI